MDTLLRGLVWKDLRLEPPFFHQLYKPAGFDGPCHRCYPQDPVAIIQVKIGPVACKGPVNLLYEREGLHPMDHVGFENFNHACKVSSLQTYSPPSIMTGGDCDIFKGSIRTKTLVKDPQ